MIYLSNFQALEQNYLNVVLFNVQKYNMKRLHTSFTGFLAYSTWQICIRLFRLQMYAPKVPYSQLDLDQGSEWPIIELSVFELNFCF